MFPYPARLVSPATSRRLRPAVVLLALLATGCVHRPSSAVDAPAPLPARFAGQLACADCAGIDYRLTLAAPDRYVLRTHYDTDRTDRDFISTGHWHRDTAHDALVLTPEDGAIERWRITDADTLTALDVDGNPVDSPRPHRLQRVDAPVAAELTDTRWRLADAPTSPDKRAPYVVFEGATSRLNGSDGCNRFAGRYEAEAQSLTVGALVGTRMACLGLPDDLGAALVQRLQTSTRAVLVGDYLLLFVDNDDGEPASVWQAAAD